mmetsp:Transcript_48327/g.95390  ORF Transcript_48327/g.95390 Transcript_48327/m.95390 type:complete len:372 (-) Transcript_48327:37-1152(-)
MDQLIAQIADVGRVEGNPDVVQADFRDGLRFAYLASPLPHEGLVCCHWVTLTNLAVCGGRHPNSLNNDAVLAVALMKVGASLIEFEEGQVCYFGLVHVSAEFVLDHVAPPCSLQSPHKILAVVYRPLLPHVCIEGPEEKEESRLPSRVSPPIDILGTLEHVTQICQRLGSEHLHCPHPTPVLRMKEGECDNDVISVNLRRVRPPPPVSIGAFPQHNSPCRLVWVRVLHQVLTHEGDLQTGPCLGRSLTRVNETPGAYLALRSKLLFDAPFTVRGLREFPEANRLHRLFLLQRSFQHCAPLFVFPRPCCRDLRCHFCQKGTDLLLSLLFSQLFRRNFLAILPPLILTHHLFILIPPPFFLLPPFNRLSCNTT